MPHSQFLGHFFHSTPPRSELPLPLNPTDGDNTEVVGKFQESIGDFFVARMWRDPVWVRGVLGGPSDDILHQLIVESPAIRCNLVKEL